MVRRGKHPWLLNASMFRRFLEAGIAVAGVDVGESYGNPEGRRIYTLFHEELVGRRSLSERVALLAQSRGGLMHHNWACEHPQNVACIAGILAVCDISSDPGLQRACLAYGLSEVELRDCLSDHNPIDRLAPLARNNVPIMHVHGDLDEGVPLRENSEEVARRSSNLGGSKEILVVPGRAHDESADFFECEALVQFPLTHGKERRSAP